MKSSLILLFLLTVGGGNSHAIEGNGILVNGKVSPNLGKVIKYDRILKGKVKDLILESDDKHFYMRRYLHVEKVYKGPDALVGKEYEFNVTGNQRWKPGDDAVIFLNHENVMGFFYSNVSPRYIDFVESMDLQKKEDIEKGNLRDLIISMRKKIAKECSVLTEKEAVFKCNIRLSAW